MDFYNLKNTNSNNNLFRQNNKINRFILDKPIGYCSYSDNDISDKLSNNNSDLEDYQNPYTNLNSLKEKQNLKNGLIPTRNYTKFTKEKNNAKINITNPVIKINNNKTHKSNQNINNHFQNMSNINNNNENKCKSNDTYLNHYITKKNYSNNKNNKKFEKIKNMKKRKENLPQENKDIANKNKTNHIKYKSLKYIMDNSYDKNEEKNEYNNKIKNNNSKIKNKLILNKYKYIGEQNKNINYNYFILNSKDLSKNKNKQKKSVLNKQSLQNKSFNQIYNINNNRNFNSIKPEDYVNKNNDFCTCLRNSNSNIRKNVEYDKYFVNSNEHLDSNTLNPGISYCKPFIDEIYNPKNVIPPKLSHPNLNKKFSKTFIDMKDIKMDKSKQYDNNENHNIISETNIKIEDFLEKGKKISNSVQKSYQKKLLTMNQKHIITKNNCDYKKKDLSIKTSFDKNNNQELISPKQINQSSKSNKEAISPAASKINNNLVNTEKLSKNKYDYLKNKIDLKKKISFNNSKNNTISNSKTISNKNNNLIVPLGQNEKNKKIDLNDKNDIKKNNTRMIVYKKRRISNSKYQPKVKKENSKNDNIDNSDNNESNYTLLLKNYFTENKQLKEKNFDFQRKNMKKITLFKPTSKEKISQNNKNKDNKKHKIEKEKMESKSDNIRINNYLRKNVNQTNIYMKGILKKWNMNAKNASIPLKVLNSKIVNKLYFNKKFYAFNIQKCKLKICFITKRYKLKMPINNLCFYSKNIILKKDNEKEKINLKDEGKIIINGNSIIKENTIDEKLSLSSNKDNQNNSKKNIVDKFNSQEDIKNINNMLEEAEENENEDFKIEEYEEKHINSIINLNKNNNLINSNSTININTILNEEKINGINNFTTIGKEIPTNSEACSLLNSKMSLNSNTKKTHFKKIEIGLEKLCRLFFRKLENQSYQGNINNIINEPKAIKKEKSDPNIKSKNKTKNLTVFSSTIQNWNDMDKKHYEKEDIPFDINNILDFKRKKTKKNRKYAKLLNINKAFSEEKIREQGDIFRRSLNLNSKIKIESSDNINEEKSNIISEEKESKESKESNSIIVNTQKEKYTELLNILTIKNYNNIFSQLLNLINNENKIFNNKNSSYEILLNNQFIFIEVLVDKAIKEKSYMSLYAKLGKDLYMKIVSNYINLNKKKVKGENLKSLISAECRQKFDESDINTILNLESNKFDEKENLFENIKFKLKGIINFICELINNKMISQKMGLEYLDLINKRINNFDNDIKNADQKNFKKYKYLYIEAELDLLEKLSKIIIERKKPKHIQNLKNFIEDYLIPIVEKNKNSEEQLSSYLICKIINFLDKLRKTKPFNNIKIVKIENKNNSKTKNEKNDEKNKEGVQNKNEDKNKNNNLNIVDNKNYIIEDNNINLDDVQNNKNQIKENKNNLNQNNINNKINSQNSNINKITAKNDEYKENDERNNNINKINENDNKNQLENNNDKKVKKNSTHNTINVQDNNNTNKVDENNKNKNNINENNSQIINNIKLF